MKRLICLLTLLFSVATAAQDDQKRIAMLISSYGNTAEPDLSYDLEELAQAYLVLRDNEVNIDLVSPKGGPVLVKTNKDNLNYIQRFKSLALKNLQNTLSAAEVSSEDYDGIFIIGGGGAMMDLPKDPKTQALLTQFAHRDAIITAVCHGPAAIVDIKLPNGRYLVDGKKVNSFTNLEERAFSKENIDKFPFLVEDKLVERGGVFTSNAPMLPFIAVDNNLITAQNPGSVAKAAEAMLVKLGLTPKSRTPFIDEATMSLISQARTNGSFNIDVALARTTEQYDLNYLALYGFYAYQLADDASKQVELDIMKTIANHFQHPMYDSSLIQALVEQGFKADAEAKFVLFKQRYPNHETLAQLAALFSATD